MRKIVAISLFGVLLLAGCTTNMAPREAGNPASSRKVLIAGEDTPFKQKVVEKLIEKLGTQDWYFRIIGLDQLAKEDTGQYGAIVLAAGYRMGRMDGRVSSALQKAPAHAKVIVFFTQGADDPPSGKSKVDLGVDSVSSASRDDRVEMRAAQLAALIEKKF